MRAPVYVTNCSALAAFKTHLVLNLWHFNYDVFLYGPLWVHLVWDSLHFLDLYVFFFPRLGKFSVIIFSNRFSVLSSLSSLSGSPLMQMLLFPILSQRSLKLSLFFKILFSFCCSEMLFSVCYVTNH